MKISREAKDYLEAQFNKDLDQAQGVLDLKLQANLLQFKTPHGTITSVLHEKNTQVRVEYVERLIKTRVELYIQSYRREGHIIDQTEYDELMSELNGLVESQIRLIGSEYQNVFSGLSQEQAKRYEEKLERGYKQALGIAKRELELAMSEMQVKEREKYRSLLIRRLYAVSRGNTSMHFNFYEITQEYGINDKEAHDYFQYFEGKDIIKARGIGGDISITGRCIIIAEDLIKKSQDEIVIAPPIKSLPQYEHQDFSFLADAGLKKIIERDYTELQQLDPNISPKSVLILSGSIIEGLLIDALVTKGDYPSAGECGRFLKDLIYPAKNAGVIKHDNLSEILRVFRNLVHPAREIKDSLNFDQSHAAHSRAAVDVIISDVRTWYANRPK